jgi:hypothetical protein
MNMTLRPPLTRPWSDDDVSTLRKLGGMGVPLRLIAIRLRRSRPAVSKKARQLKLGTLIAAAAGQRAN